MGLTKKQVALVTNTKMGMRERPSFEEIEWHMTCWGERERGLGAFITCKPKHSHWCDIYELCVCVSK